jgi:3-deoxy-manno-octulosonate cytidylyltransferase (CMP-KDO synthetase)
VIPVRVTEAADNSVDGEANVHRSNGSGPHRAVVAVIPARYGSTRLPGKPLLAETGWPLIRHVVEAARRSNRLGRVIVATDDERIAAAVAGFGGEAVLTRADHPSGTDRVAEVAAGLPDARIVVNLQGDEPEISAQALDRVVALLEDDPGAMMSTLATPIRDEAVYRDPACVKVVVSASGRALYFSRSPIPHHRDSLADPRGLLHLGLYAYRREFLLSLATLPTSPLECAEKLEQLRVLEAGYSIVVGIVDEPSIGIDTPEDYWRFVTRWRGDGSAGPVRGVAQREGQ